MINSIRLQNFRSYSDASFEFEPGANIVVGPNASGKTNLLEAVMVLAGSGSYKSKDINLIKHRSKWFRLDGFFASQERSVKFELKNDSQVKTYVINQKSYSRLSIENNVSLVYFEPEQLQSITRGPENRRAYFDELLERSQVGFKQTANAYRRTLAQRNALLKRGQSSAANQIFAWNVRLGDLGSKIAQSRQALADDLNKRLSKTYSKIAGHRTKAAIHYTNQFPIENYASRLVSTLEKNFSKDLERGFTSHGPHREDFELSINAKLVNETASRGETRSLLLALKKLELDLMQKTRGQKPILLLDDVFSELDGARRQALVDIISDHQAIITTTDADTAIEYFADDKHNLIPLTNKVV